MDDDNKFKLIKTPEKLDRPNNFWKVCPRMLEYLPKEHCMKGKPNISDKSARVQDEPECVWWINSPDHNYCFWKYVNDKSNVDGVMPELVQSDLAHLFGWSNTKTHFVLKEAIQELTNALEVHGAIELLNNMTQEEYQDFLNSSDFNSDDDSQY